MKTKVAVLFGGKSVEHEVSVISGLQALRNIDRAKYDVIPLYITKNNEFYTGDNLCDIAAFKDIPTALSEATRVLLVPIDGGRVQLLRYPMKKFGNNVVDEIDVAFPVVHGTNVEDGTLMGYLEMLGIPYVGCDVMSAAIGMDKYLMKAALKNAGIPVLDAVSFTGRDYIASTNGILAGIEQTMGFPVIVKPVNLGSSVGIAKAKDRASLEEALNTAFTYAPKVLVEPAVQPLREINCAVIGDVYAARASACEQPFGNDDILSFTDKYQSGGSKDAGAKTGGSKAGGGMSSLQRQCPANLPEETTKTIQKLAVKTFRALGCSGVARIDFLNNPETDEWWVNEINTIPGSLAFYLFEADGVPFKALLTEMIELAFKRQRERESLNFSYDTNLLATASLGGSKGAKR